MTTILDSVYRMKIMPQNMKRSISLKDINNEWMSRSIIERVCVPVCAGHQEEEAFWIPIWWQAKQISQTPLGTSFFYMILENKRHKTLVFKRLNMI